MMFLLQRPTSVGLPWICLLSDSSESDFDAPDFCNMVIRCLQKSEAMFVKLAVFFERLFKFYTQFVILSLGFV